MLDKSCLCVYFSGGEHSPASGCSARTGEYFVDLFASQRADQRGEQGSLVVSFPCSAARLSVICECLQLGQTALHVLVKAGYGIDEAKVLLDWPTCDLSLKDKVPSPHKACACFSDLIVPRVPSLVYRKG